MKLPIWIASWEIECCQPDAIVGTSWTTYPFVNIGSQPWWAEHATQPIPVEVAELGTITLTGTIATHGDRTTITSRGVTLPIHGPAPKPPFTARLFVDAHTDATFPVTGIVERVLGIKYQPKNGWPIASSQPPKSGAPANDTTASTNTSSHSAPPRTATDTYLHQMKIREFYWLPEVGPSAYLLFVLANAWMPPDDGATITVNYDELAHSAGTAPGRLAKSLQRLAGFHLAHTLPDEPSTLYLKRRAPTLNDNQLARLAQRCPTAAACHEEQRYVA